jgi:hypothetical protein
MIRLERTRLALHVPAMQKRDSKKAAVRMVSSAQLQLVRGGTLYIIVKDKSESNSDSIK